MHSSEENRDEDIQEKWSTKGTVGVHYTRFMLPSKYGPPVTADHQMEKETKKVVGNTVRGESSQL